MKRTRSLIIVVALAVVAPACSSQRYNTQVASLESVSTTSVGPTEGELLADAEEAMITYTRCLRDRGIDIGDPTIGSDGSLQLPPIEFTIESDGSEGGGPDVSQFEDLIAPCEELPGGAVRFGSGSGDAAFAGAMLEYTQCMRDNGVGMPDPHLSGSGLVDLGEMNQDDFEAADAVCRSVFESFSLNELIPTQSGTGISTPLSMSTPLISPIRALIFGRPDASSMLLFSFTPPRLPISPDIDPPPA